MFELVNEYNQNAVIKVIGVGGGGGNAVMSMLESKIHGAEFILANTDSQALEASPVPIKIQLGIDLTNHAKEEMSYLSNILPSIYRENNE